MRLEIVSTRLEALGNVTRLRMVIEVANAGAAGLSVGELRDRIGISAGSTVSHHLRQLVSAGLLDQERRGTTLICRARMEVLSDLATFLTTIPGKCDLG
ncbi:helix-turn-helix transcriptional regulator [Methylobacterium sp. WL103]|uniref:ArsR/SmtB family transcription factor n=1 Tax=Methylobacterium sp. WL103 TaxID=2603891 RepID=UPI0011CC7A3B|nr:metalloregulator ArsR/SmtB family transcription factor [Methylobacterium sp. WL103]TXM94292.1 helix-turn-helix transcriptional regulator [Methylobacterium sp. WL103]